MKLTAAAALAKAAGVSLDWLAVGEGSPESSVSPIRHPGEPPESPPPSGPIRLFNTLQIPKFAGALEAVMNRFRDAGVEPDMEDAVRAVA